MKLKTLAVLIMFFSSLTLGAQVLTPEQNFEKLREEFKNAELPSRDDLKLHQNWNCQEYSSLGGTLTVNLVFNQKAPRSYSVDIVRGNYVEKRSSLSLDKSSQSLVGSWNSDGTPATDDLVTMHYNFRVTSRGALIQEASIGSNARALHEDTTTYTSLIDPQRLAIGYIMCEVGE